MKRLCALAFLALALMGLALPGAAMAHPQDWAAIYYAPHPDDDAIGMAQSIAKHVEAGRPVHVVLFTDGEASGVYSKWAANTVIGSPARDLDNDGETSITVNDFALARRAEFVSAMKALGVPEANLSFRGRANPNGPNLLPEGASDTLFQFSDGNIPARYQDVKNVMSWYEGKYTVGVHRPSHKTVMRYVDSAFKIGDVSNHRDHWYISEGLDFKCDRYGYDGRFYKVRIYEKAASSRIALHKESATTAQHAKKQAALNCYAIGKASVPVIIRGAYADFYEYMTTPAEF